MSLILHVCVNVWWILWSVWRQEEEMLMLIMNVKCFQNHRMACKHYHYVTSYTACASSSARRRWIYKTKRSDAGVNFVSFTAPFIEQPAQHYHPLTIFYSITLGNIQIFWIGAVQFSFSLTFCWIISIQCVICKVDKIKL